MNISRCITIVLGFVCMMCIVCSEKDSGTNPQENRDYLGTWVSAVPPIPFNNILPESVYVEATINENETYSLFSWYARGDTALKHKGTWAVNANSDTLFLQGNECAIFDTARATLDPVDCGDPAAVPIIVSNHEWVVNITDLEPVADGLGVDVSDPMIRAISITLYKDASR